MIPWRTAWAAAEVLDRLVTPIAELLLGRRPEPEPEPPAEEPEPPPRRVDVEVVITRAGGLWYGHAPAHPGYYVGPTIDPWEAVGEAALKLTEE